jgi:hypothetical protein
MTELPELYTASDAEPPPDPLTPRQRFTAKMLKTFANDLARGDVGEQRTAALLHLVVDSIEREYESVLVAVAVAWRREAEGGE